MHHMIRDIQQVLIGIIIFQEMSTMRFIFTQFFEVYF